jgi:DNA (cytosine-5)-methyltransferase 1
VKHYGDVSKISGSQIEPVDIITFGSPCQDLSVAGKREGMKHAEQGDEETTRSGLFYEAIRIIEEMREATNGEYPKYAVWENVPGAFSSNKGRDFHAVLEAFCSVCDDTVSIPKPYDPKRTDRLVWNKSGEIVGDNYSVAWRTLDAQYWGVPQRRKRIYLVADFTGRRAGEILFKPESLRGDFAQGDETGQEVATDAVGSVNGSSGNGGQLAATVISSYGTKWNGNAGAYNGENFVLQKPSSEGSVRAAGVVSKGNGECFIMPERHMSLSIGGGQAGQGYPCAVYSFDSLSSNSMKSSNPNSGCRAVEIAKCIDTTCPDPSKNQGGIAIVQPVIALQANGIDRADTTGCNGCGWRYNESYTLNTIDRHAVCYQEKIGALQARDYKGVGNQYVCEDKLIVERYNTRGNGDGETACTITGDHQNRITDYTAVAVQEAKSPRKYIIRRLTPTECARLQGFPDWWGELAPYDPADADFWESVRKTHAEINGKKYKPVKNLKAWYEKLHNDGAEYKMWGNGIALPCAQYVLQGIAEQGAQTLGSLFDGSGGFPLAGVLNGIKPIWASEVEPFPIAVTKSRFKEEQE